MQLLISSAILAQTAYSEWEMNRGAEGVLNVKALGIDLKQTHGNPIAYNHAKIPPKIITDAKAPKWESAPKDANGNVNFSESSSLECYQQLDFTYFRTFIDIPATGVQRLTVTINKVDDGARMMIFNSKHPKGQYNAANDGKLAGTAVTTDFSKDFAPGEVNTIVIVQMDDCKIHNNMTGGLTVKVNNQEVKPSVNPPAAIVNFRKTPYYIDLNNLRAYSVNAQTLSSDQANIYGLVAAANGECSIKKLGDMKADESYLAITEVSLGNGLFALKVSNELSNTYLTVGAWNGATPTNNRIYKKALSTIPDDAKFRKVNPLTNAQGSAGFSSYQCLKNADYYIRHEGYKLEVDPKSGTNNLDLYQKDATWRIEKLK